MKKTALILVIAMLLCSAGCAGSGSSGFVKTVNVVYPKKITSNVGSAVLKILNETPVEQSFIDAVNAFSFDSAKRLLAGDKNFCYSPVSLYFALAACAAGAAGETGREMLDALCVGDERELFDGCRSLFKRIWIDSDSTQIKVTNALFVDDGLNGVKSGYADTLKKDFYASLRTVDYSQTKKTKEIMSKHISENTGGRLSYDGEVDPAAVFTIINTVYFLSRWMNPFDKKDTKTDAFHAPDGDTPCQMMFKRISGATYYRGDGFVRIELPFECHSKMAFILPDEGRMDDVLALGAEAFTGGEEMKAAVVELYLPKFTFTNGMDLIGLLKDMGVTSIFDPFAADFSEMKDMPLYVSEVYQSTFISVDEEKVEAAAATRITGKTGGTGSSYEPVIIRFDRPFLYAIMTSDVPLFTGVVAKPPAK